MSQLATRPPATAATASGPAVTTKPGVTRPQPSNFILKLIMAVSGVMFIGFLFMHMFGNLKAFPFFGGEHSFNNYAIGLRTLLYPYVPVGMVLWILRIALLVAFVAHIYAALTLRHRGKTARGAHSRTGFRSSHSKFAKWMLVSGTLILAYVVIHLLDLTFGTLVAHSHVTFSPDPAKYPGVHAGDHYPLAYTNLYNSLSRWWMAAIYAVTNLLILTHVLHGGWSVAHDFGITGKRVRATVIGVITLLAALVALGNVVLPIVTALGLLPAPGAAGH